MLLYALLDWNRLKIVQVIIEARNIEGDFSDVKFRPNSSNVKSKNSKKPSLVRTGGGIFFSLEPGVAKGSPEMLLC